MKKSAVFFGLTALAVLTALTTSPMAQIIYPAAVPQFGAPFAGYWPTAFPYPYPYPYPYSYQYPYASTVITPPVRPGGALGVTVVNPISGRVDQSIDIGRVANGLPPVWIPNGTGGGAMLWNR